MRHSIMRPLLLGILCSGLSCLEGMGASLPAIDLWPGTPPGETKTFDPEKPVSSNTPPTFIPISQDDPVRVENALHYSVALQAAKVPMELHVYPTGGHGYGLRRTEIAVTTWPDRAADWLRSRGLLTPKP